MFTKKASSKGYDDSDNDESSPSSDSEEEISDVEEAVVLMEEERIPMDVHEKEKKKVEAAVSKLSTSATKGKASLLKILVSKQKKRFSEDGFNLDLTYVTPQIVAMGFPSQNYESIYRNSMPQVQKFFNQRHPGHYKIYNLCAEKRYKYDHSCFREVAEFGSLDHQAPNFELMFAFCKDVDEFLKSDPENVAGIHCKAGKGRTGVMICCYLLYSKQFTQAYDALRYYGMMRTKNGKGVTIPSQIRYIHYFERVLELEIDPESVPITRIKIEMIRLRSIPRFNLLGGCTPFFRIKNGDDFEYISKKQFSLKSYKNEPYIEFADIKDVVVSGDVLIDFMNKPLMSSKEKMFQMWFNTGFLSPEGKMTVCKQMLDKASKDKKNKKFNSDFHIEIFYSFVTVKS